MAQYSTLAAVNLMLEAIGDPHVDELETGEATVAGDAEAMLDRVVRDIQARGWTCNMVRGYENELPTKKITVTNVVGTFAYDETVTETTSGATGRVKAYLSGVLHIVPDTGTFVGTYALTGGTSGATATGTVLSTVTENYLFVDETNWTRVTRAERESKNVVKRGQYLFDTDPDDGGSTFDGSVYLDITRILYFVDLPYNLAAYVAAEAAFQFARWKKRSPQDLAELRESARLARIEAIREDNDAGQNNYLNTPEMLRVKGSRLRDASALSY